MRGRLLGAWLLLAALHLALSARHLDRPGLNYDEALQAAPARDFVEGRAAEAGVPLAETVEVFGRPLPWRTQLPYLGALKSQLLVPVFALFGSSTEVLRLTTIAWGLAGLLCAMAFAARVLGASVALVAGALLASDPSFLLLVRHDWGPVAPGLLLRCAALWLLCVGWRERRGGVLVAGALAAGLAFANKADVAAFAAAAVLALLTCRPDLVRGAARPGAAALGAAAAAFALGAAPMLLSARRVLSAGRLMRGDEGWPERIAAIRWTLDGSYFHRVMETGGLWGEMGGVEGAPTGLLAAALLPALAVLAWDGLAAKHPLLPRQGARFVLATTLLGLAAVALLPGVGRAHHAMNVAPFPQLALAAAVVALARAAARSASAGMAARVGWGAGVLLSGALVVANVSVVVETLGRTERSGGRGRWSDSLDRYVDSLRGRRELVLVSLDWGFHAPIRLIARGPSSLELHWSVARALRAREAVVFRGGADHVYLAYGRRYALFPYGSGAIDAAAALAEQGVRVRWHRDRSGAPAFASIHIPRRHELVFRPDRVEIRIGDVPPDSRFSPPASRSRTSLPSPVPPNPAGAPGWAHEKRESEATSPKRSV